MGKDLDQMIEAVADAATGEFERLKEFGIKSSSQGDQVTFTFQGIKTTVGKNAAEIEGYLKGIGNVNFAGAMERRAATLDGAISNLGDSWDNLFLTMSQGGSGELIESGVRGLSSALKVAAENTDILTRFALLGATAWGTYYLATKAATRGNVGIAKSVPLIGAALAGMEIGSYLSDEFAIVRQAGIAMVAGLVNGWEHVKYAAKVASAGLKLAFDVAIDAIKLSFGGLIITVSEGLKYLPGMDGVTAEMDAYAASLNTGGDHAERFAQKMKELGKARDNAITGNDAVFTEMFTQADKPAAKKASVDPSSSPKAVIPEASSTLTADETAALVDAARSRFAQMTEIEAVAQMDEETRAIDAFQKKIDAMEADKELLISNGGDKLALQAQFDAAEANAALSLEDKIYAIRAQAAAKEKALDDKVQQDKVNGEKQFWGDAMSLTASGSRELFEIGKAAKLSNAVISGYSAATSAWEVGMLTGPWTAAAYTAASLLKTGTLISSIESSSFGSASSSTTGGGGTPSVATSAGQQVGTVQQPTATAQQAPAPIINNHFTGNVMDERYINDFVMPTLANQINTGDSIMIAPDSAQAAVLTG